MTHCGPATRSIALRDRKAGRLLDARAAFQVESDERHVVLHLPVGSPGFPGTDTATVLGTDFCVRKTSEKPSVLLRGDFLDVVIVHRFGDEWSTWRWSGGGRRRR